ncbi:MAG: flavodoxin [Bernardetiaceae bacterium]|nr:flavodoxin [Bernardetiaceae bacterium]
MALIGLFYGTDTGNTENVSNKIVEMLGEENVDIFNFGETEAEAVAPYDFLLFGAPTWYDGELQSDWEEILPKFEEIDFTGKKIAIYGLGDQWGYGEWFCDAIGMIAEVIEKKGGTIVGHWALDGYDYEASKGERDGKFLGLPIDEDNQPELTDERLATWIPQVLAEFGMEVEA